MTTADLDAAAAFSELVLQHEFLGDIEPVADFLHRNGWKPVGTDPVEGDRWTRSASSTAVTAFTRAAAEGRGAALGLLVRSESLPSAAEFRDRLRAAIESLTLQGRMQTLSVDDVWSRWADGDREVLLGLLPPTTVEGTAVPAAVQLAVELPPPDP